MFLSSRTKRTMGWWRSWPAWLPFGPVMWRRFRNWNLNWTERPPTGRIMRRRGWDTGLPWKRSVLEMTVDVACESFCGRDHGAAFPTEMTSAQKSDFAVGFHYQRKPAFMRREIWGLEPGGERGKGKRRPVLQEAHCEVFTAFHLCGVMEGLRKGPTQCFPLIQHDLGLLSLVHLTCTLEASSPGQQCKAWAGLHLRVVVKRAVDVKTRCPRLRSSLSGKLGQVAYPLWILVSSYGRWE